MTANVHNSGNPNVPSTHVSASHADRFTRFTTEIDHIKLPEKFTFPFYYQPHPLSLIAASELQTYLQMQSDWEHNFGLQQDQDGLIIGKMFGVLVVRNANGELGYLAAFSGKLANSNHHDRFVPPVFDVLEQDGFFKRGEAELNVINQRISELEQLPELAVLHTELRETTARSEADQTAQKQRIKAAKKERDSRRKALADQLSPEEWNLLQEELAAESLKEKFVLNDIIRHYQYLTDALKSRIAAIESEINSLKEARRLKSSALQQQIFDEYDFLNAHGQKKSLGDIFSQTTELKPPAGSGECAAPKLLQYAYLHGLEPIALAEFWWGQSPASEVRKHGHFYPACRGKCEPILSHMLQGLETDPNPMLTNPAEGKELDIIFEDEWILAVNKPAEFLSVPGKTISDSVYTRVQKLYPDATGPLIVHRLDMSTSGVLVLAKDKRTHQKLQSQFIKREVKKRYVALLEGLVNTDEGFVDLPLRVDLEDRPRQLVCYEYGKPAKTRWKVVKRSDTHTRIHFYPITGRTHQLRVHAAHQLGLNAPIVGDDLYGIKANRLHLHAEKLGLTHPVTGKRLVLHAPVDF